MWYKNSLWYYFSPACCRVPSLTASKFHKWNDNILFFFFPHQFGLHKWQLHSTSEVIEAFTNWHGLLIRAERLLGWLISQKALYLPWLCCNKHRSQPTSKNWSGKKNKFHVMLSWRSFSRKGSRMKLVWTIWFPLTVPRAYLVLSQRPTCSML